MISFINCPFCSGHESISSEAADKILRMIERSLEDHTDPELENIRNTILSYQERGQQPEYVPPICPTPDKRKYSNREHALPYAVKWRQHAYACDCGYWHLSKQTPAQHQAKINSPPASPDEFETIDPLLL